MVYNIADGTSIIRVLPQIADEDDNGGQYMVPHLFTCGSRVLIAVHIMRNINELLEVIIWELEKVMVNSSSSSSSWWKEISRMPPSDVGIDAISGPIGFSTN